MKNILKFLVTGAAVLFMASCEEYLTIQHYDILPDDFMFQNEDNVQRGLNGIYDTFYTTQGAGDDDPTWGFKPQIFIANHSAMDCQASGWDSEWQRHAVQPDKGSLGTAWRMSYRAIDRVNRFLDGLAKADQSIFASAENVKYYEAEAKAIRAFNNFYLTKVFGRVPILKTGDTYSNSPGKPRPESVDEMYAFIEQDFKEAMEILKWEPRNGEYGRITKGFCYAYLAELYMYQEKFAEAKKLLGDIINSGTYALEPCYGNLHGWNQHWTKESIFEVMYAELSYMGWGGNNVDMAMWYSCMCAAPEYGGWGSLCLSYELYRSFEPGDKRKMYSMVAKGDTNPFTGETIGVTPGFDGWFQGSENMPTVYTIKYWKNNPNSTQKIFVPHSLTFKRLAGVMLDYAECCFETGDPTTGWEMIKQIRNRAWGNLEVGKTVEGAFNETLNTSVVEVPDAQTFYTQYKEEKGYSAEPWKVAVLIERRHELNQEFDLYFSMVRMGLADQWFKCEYPNKDENSQYRKDGGSVRYFDYQDYMAVFPIPTNEILRNPDINQEDQNPGY
ncbi:MAG: RagB/SusD family nutrient uptake outer membrane protein [Bacteroidales bacterium]|nr:RagB/SusD family nutrient uptake outer membrane protein [Bacteroidales bacterium]